MIIFFHIPKTGGSTLLNKFKNEYSDYFIVNENTINKINYNHNYSIFMGHNIMGIDKKFDNEINCEYISFFRNPIDQFVSNFYYIKNNISNILHKYLKNISLEEFLDSDMVFESFDNYQIRVVANKYNPKSGLIVKKQSDEYKESILMDALNNLNNIDNVFLYEKYNESLSIIRDKYGLTDRFVSMEYYNKTKNRLSIDSLSDSIKNKIRKRMKYDITFYEHVLKKTKSIYR